jgi:hypothetical protein
MVININLFGSQIIPDIIYENIYIENPYEIFRLKMRNKFFNKFTNDKNEQCIAFYYSETKDKREGDYEFIYEKIKIYVIHNNVILKSYNIYYEFLGDNYRPLDEAVIKSLEPVFGKWNGYFYLYDLNKNGINEIFIFPEKAGGHVVMTIYEFRKDRFVRLTPSRFDMDRLDEISVDINNSSFTIKIQYEFEEHKEGHREKTYKWNGKKQVYELVRDVHVEVLKKK